MKRLAFIAALVALPFRKLAQAAPTRVKPGDIQAPNFGNGLYGYEGGVSKGINLGAGLSLGGGLLSFSGGGSPAPAPNYADEVTAITVAGQTVTLLHTPLVMGFGVYKNGIRMRNGAAFDYTLTGQTITPVAAQGFNVGDSIEVEYYW